LDEFQAVKGEFLSNIKDFEVKFKEFCVFFLNFLIQLIFELSVDNPSLVIFYEKFKDFLRVFYNKDAFDYMNSAEELYNLFYSFKKVFSALRKKTFNRVRELSVEC